MLKLLAQYPAFLDKFNSSVTVISGPVLSPSHVLSLSVGIRILVFSTHSLFFL
jgi:hypothetical protein